MSQPEPDPDPTNPAARAALAVDVGQALADLALRYWAEGRARQALRVAREAERVLGAAPAGTPARAHLAALVRTLEDDLRPD